MQSYRWVVASPGGRLRHLLTTLPPSPPKPPRLGLDHNFFFAVFPFIGWLLVSFTKEIARLIFFSRPAHDTASAWFNFISWRKGGVAPLPSFSQRCYRGQSKSPKIPWCMICSYISAGPFMVVMWEYKGGAYSASSALADPPCDWWEWKLYSES